ncbi:hypothetical protein QBC39DRAFT_25543 [Podospora conica]|nr:hypothetical protein QBC39DRAFT_25543 [Schizothecium conicum]
MAVQLPEGARAIAGCIVAWSIICLCTSVFLVHLVWVHNERRSYVALMGAFTSLSVIASLGQQLNTIINWDDIKIAQWQNVKDNVGNPELNITGASTGADLVLFYIQYYTYNVESLLVFFWAVELVVSVYHIRKINFYSLPASIIAKGIAVFLPAIQQILLRFTVKYHTVTGYMVLADFIMLLSFGLGCMILVAILSKYVHGRIALISWNVNYGERSGGTDLNSNSNALGSQAIGSQAGRRRVRQPRMRSIYDRWLVLRFTIAFIALGLFEVVVVTFQLRASSTNTIENIPETPDLSAGRAIADFARFAPGVTAGPLMFIIFGTTRTFREYMARIFLPEALRARLDARRAHKRKPSGGSVVVNSGLPPPVPPKPSPGGGPDLEAGARYYSHKSDTHIRMQSFGRHHNLPKEDSEEDEWRATDERRDKVETDDELPIMKPAALASHPPRYSRQ